MLQKNFLCKNRLWKVLKSELFVACKWWNLVLFGCVKSCKTVLKCLCKARWNCVNIVGVFGLPAVVVEPLNITAYVGASVTMSCQTSLSAPVDWHRKLLSVVTLEIFCYHGSITEGYEDKFSISNPRNDMYLVTVKNIQLNDSGEYRCTEGVDKDPDYGTVLLRVIGNDISFYHASSKLTVCQSFTFWYCTEMNAHIIKLFPPCSRGMTSFFSECYLCYKIPRRTPLLGVLNTQRIGENLWLLTEIAIYFGNSTR